MSRHIVYPFTLDKIEDLKVGEKVKVSGKIYTGRDRLHKYLADGGVCPVDLKDGAIYHCGPVVVRKDGVWHVQSAGPTTSIRQEPYMSKIIGRYQLRVIIGKGGMGEDTRRSCVRFGCVYLQTVGGAGAVLAQHVERVERVFFLSELGITEAMWELAVKDLEAIVAIDTRGRSLFNRIRQASQRALSTLLS